MWTSVEADRAEKPILEVATRHFAYSLLPENLADTLNVIVVVRELPTEGWTFEIRGGKFPIHKIEINKDFSLLLKLETLAHEMIHIAQVVEGRLSWDYNKKEFVWEGEIYITTNVKDLSDTPWEKETEHLEYELMEEFIYTLGTIYEIPNFQRYK